MALHLGWAHLGPQLREAARAFGSDKLDVGGKTMYP